MIKKILQIAIYFVFCTLLTACGSVNFPAGKAYFDTNPGVTTS